MRSVRQTSVSVKAFEGKIRGFSIIYVLFRNRLDRYMQTEYIFIGCYMLNYLLCCVVKILKMK